MLPIVAGGALALLAVGGIAYALTRRRRHEDEDAWVEDETTYDHAEPEPMMHEPPAMENAMAAEQPAIVAPPVSAFAWGNEQRREEQRSEEPMVEEERMPGESWIQRAYRGPSPSNPSVSLKARLKRAAFFDKRERDVAAGKAEPVDMDAGLPEAMVEEQERELA
jgi:hypothetical protein